MSPDEGKEEMEEAQADIRKKEEEVFIYFILNKIALYCSLLQYQNFIQILTYRYNTVKYCSIIIRCQFLFCISIHPLKHLIRRILYALR